MTINHSSMTGLLLLNNSSLSSFLFTAILPYFTSFPPFFSYSMRRFFHTSISSFSYF
jgi:hypothetical protein